MPPLAITIGNFDGVHRGHVALVARARAAVGPGGRVLVMSFDPHPTTLLRPELAPAPLSRFQERIRLLREAGADEVVRLEPTRALLGLSPEAFLTDIVKRHAPSAIVEGPDFRFGLDRRGSVETLRAASTAMGFEAVVVDPVEVALLDQHLVRVSSTLLRWLIERGRVGDAACLLGRPYALESTVVSGDKRGRTIGVPTANLGEPATLLPADGIYAGTAWGPGGCAYPAAISVGTKPTFGAAPRVCEVHLVGYDGPVDDYGWTVRVTFERWLRGQIRYAGIEPLVEQLQRDIAAAREAMAWT